MLVIIAKNVINVLTVYYIMSDFLKSETFLKILFALIPHSIKI